MLNLEPPVFLLVCACLFALSAATTDLRDSTIPNVLTLPLLVAAPLVHAFHAGPGALLPSLLGSLVCGLVPFALFCRNAMGGGDVKAFAALGAVFGADVGLQVQLLSLSCAAVYASAVLTFRGELLAMLTRSARLVLPLARRRTDDDADVAHTTSAMTSLRLGPAIAVATTLAVASHLAAWLT